ncbi:MAG: DUF5678 domain-containing protein [Candidatus Paceibacterota bacterium]|jgi:hypothetical protein
MLAIDWTKIYKKYKGMWVALLDDEITVVGYGKTLKEAMSRAKKNGYDHPIFTRMPPNSSAFAGGAL